MKHTKKNRINKTAGIEYTANKGLKYGGNTTITELRKLFKVCLAQKRVSKRC